MQWQWIITQSDCAMQYKVYFIWQPVATISAVGLRRSCKALSKAKLTHTHTHTQRIMVTVVLSDTSLICYSFLDPGKFITSEKYAQQINGMHQNPQCLQLAWQHLTTHRTTNASNVERIRSGSNVLPHLPFSPDLSPTDYHFLKQLNNFCRENSTASKTQKMLSNCSSNPRAQIFMLQEYTYFLFEKMCWL